MSRILTAAVLVPLVLAVVEWAPLWLFAALIAAVALVALHEFYALAAAQHLPPFRWLGSVATTLTVLVLMVPWPPAAAWFAPWLGAVLVGTTLVVFMHALREPEAMALSIGRMGATVLGILYLGLFMGATGAVRMWGPKWLYFLLATVWLGDTAAYYAGRAWGRHRLAPRVSPKKSWEGSLASLAAAAGVGWCFGQWFAGHALGYAALGVALNLFAQAGDLAESLLKRGAQVKDSGTLLPGHGGMLDRIDAMLFAAPVLWYYLAYFHPRP